MPTAKQVIVGWRKIRATDRVRKKFNSGQLLDFCFDESTAVCADRILSCYRKACITSREIGVNAIIQLITVECCFYCIILNNQTQHELLSETNLFGDDLYRSLGGALDSHIRPVTIKYHPLRQRQKRRLL